MEFLDETAIEYISMHNMKVYNSVDKIIDSRFCREYNISKNNEHFVLRLIDFPTVVKIELIAILH